MRARGARPPTPFVVGYGRSGNTLLRLMLDAHPELAIPPETDFIPEVALATRSARDPADAFLLALLAHWRLRDLQISSVELAGAVRRLTPFDLSEAFRLVYRTYAAKFGKTRWGDKTPSYLRHMPLVAEVLPEARFIHIIRDGRDAWLSICDLWFGPDSVEAAAKLWRDTLLVARRDAQLVPHYVEVRYERLVLEPEETLRELCDYLELAWDPAVLRAHERAPERIGEVVSDYRVDGRLVASVSERHRIHALTAQPPDGTRVGRWRRELPQHDAVVFDAIAGQTLADLGYELATRN